jgi:arginyl-tRNA synthetase
MNAHDTIKKELHCVAGAGVFFSLTQPEESTHGDYATNIAFVVAKQKGVSPKAAAEDLAIILQESLSSFVEKIEVAGPGFINFFIKDDVRTDEAEEIATYGILRPFREEKILVEYTDPNPFKLFHIGHIVPNALGESLARLYETKGYDVSRICYQGDKGMHVAKTIVGILWLQKHADEDSNFAEEFFSERTPLSTKITMLGNCYALGNAMFEDDNLYDTFVSLEEKKNYFKAINKKIYDGSDDDINAIYDLGKRLSLDYFEVLYQKLGTKFDHYIFESDVADEGVRIVKENLGNVFEESDGALVYKGEKVGLHTRVFVNSEGLPTYEAKEIGNTYKKQSLVPEAKQSIVVTAHEIDEYFKVIKAVLSEIDAPLAEKLIHISHGMLRLPEGKMSSRKGNIIAAEELINQVSDQLRTRLDDMKVADQDKEKLLNDIAVGAIKFSILKSVPGKDMIFDFEKSISFEGDSGPYLQYTHARLSALLDKAHTEDITFEYGYVLEEQERDLERVLIEYTQVLEKAYQDLGPHHIIQYLLSLTRIFNNMYARVQIVNMDNKDTSAYYVMLATATKNILAHGLYVLGIKAPERM